MRTPDALRPVRTQELVSEADKARGYYLPLHNSHPESELTQHNI